MILTTIANGPVVIFRTLDRLESVAQAPDEDINRLSMVHRPIINSKGQEYRRYEWRGEIKGNLRVFEETNE